MRNSQRTRVAGAALMAAGALIAALVLARGALVERAWAADRDPLRLGVVEMKTLLQAHPEYERLQQMDQELDLLRRERELLPFMAGRAKADEAQKKMREALEKGRKELEAEYRRVTGELESLGASMGAQLQREADALQAHYKAQLDREVQQLRPQDINLGKDANQRMKEFLGDLQMVLQQRVTARRLELEKQVQSKLEAERQRVESEVAAYETSLMQENQEKKLNIQLKLQVVEDPQEEADLQQQLSALGDEEYARKEQKRNELFGQLEAMRAQEKAALESQVAAYERSLNAEVQQKAAAEKARLAGLPSAAAPVPADIQQKIARIRANLDAEMAARKAQMQGEMQARQAAARERLQKKQKEVEQRIKLLQKQLQEMVEKAGEEVSGETKERMDALDQQIEKGETDRKQLYARMVEDMAEKVGRVAKKQGVQSVIGDYVVNMGLPDLTDQSMVAIKQTER